MEPMIDVSYHQGGINWSEVASNRKIYWPKGTWEAPIGAAAIKATGEEIGRLFVDPRFNENWKAAGDAGIRRGAYHFLNGAGGTKGGEEEADFFLTAIEKAGGWRYEHDLLPIVDVEFPVNAKRFDPEQLMGFLDYFGENAVTSLCKPIIYTGKWYWDAIGGAELALVSDHMLWLAAYVDTVPPPPRPFTEVAIWQFTDKGRIDGINAPVDVNRVMRSLGSLVI